MLDLGRLHPYPQIFARLERLASNKQSSLLKNPVNYDRKKFYRPQVLVLLSSTHLLQTFIKTFSFTFCEVIKLQMNISTQQAKLPSMLSILMPL